MALKTKISEAPAPAIMPEVYLELASLHNYHRGVGEKGKRYVKGVAYKFPMDVALTMLSEADNGKSIWRRVEASQLTEEHTVKKVAKVVEDGVVAVFDTDDTPVSKVDNSINIGDDSEIADIIKDEGDVTV